VSAPPEPREKLPLAGDRDPVGLRLRKAVGGPSIVEQIGPSSYISYLGAAGASIPAGSPTMISAPFRGLIEYCELKPGIVQYSGCSDSSATVKARCTSANSRLTLTPR